VGPGEDYPLGVKKKTTCLGPIKKKKRGRPAAFEKIKSKVFGYPKGGGEVLS